MGGGSEKVRQTIILLKIQTGRKKKGINGDMSAVMEGRTQSLSRHLSCRTKGAAQEYVGCKQFPDFLDNLPSSNGVPTGLKRTESERAGFKSGTFPSNSLSFCFPATIRSPIISQRSREELVFSPTHPKITAFQSMILFSDGAPLTPVGGSS